MSNSNEEDLYFPRVFAKKIQDQLMATLAKFKENDSLFKEDRYKYMKSQHIDEAQTCLKPQQQTQSSRSNRPTKKR
jgi:hypothetical protein